MLSHDLFCSRCGSNFYGMHEPLTEPEATDRVDWCWAVSQENGKWVVDFPPEKLDAFVARKKAALAEMRELVSNIRNHVVEKLKSVQTRLVASSSQFQIGSPMLFRLETVNSGNEEVGFSNFGIRYHPLVVWDANGQKIPLPADKDSGQLAVGRTKLPPGATEIVADKLDLAAFYKLDAPGKYHVQFDGTKLSFGEITNTMPGISRFGEDDASLSRFDFAGLITVTNTIPSAAVEFEVVP